MPSIAISLPASSGTSPPAAATYACPRLTRTRVLPSRSTSIRYWPAAVERDRGIRRVDLEGLPGVDLPDAKRRRPHPQRELLHLVREVQRGEVRLGREVDRAALGLELQARAFRRVEAIAQRHREVEGRRLPVVRVVAAAVRDLPGEVRHAYDRLPDVVAVRRLRLRGRRERERAQQRDERTAPYESAVHVSGPPIHGRQ